MRSCFAAVFMGLCFSFFAEEEPAISDWSADIASTGADSSVSERSVLNFSGDVSAYAPLFPFNLPGMVASLGIKHSTFLTQLSLQLQVDTAFFQSPPSRPEDLIREAYIRLIWKDFSFSLGYLLPVWNPDDDLAILDVITTRNFFQPLLSDYPETRAAQPMVYAEYLLSNGMLVELAYLPLFTSDRGPQSDSLTVNLPEMTTQSQVAARVTGNIHWFDYGLIYYFGFLKSPVTLTTAPFTGGYVRTQTFGMSAQFTADPVVFSTEASYYLTDTPISDQLRYQATLSVSISQLRLLWEGGVSGVYSFNGNSVPTPGGTSQKTISYLEDVLRDRLRLTSFLEGRYFSVNFTPWVEGGFDLLTLDWYFESGMGWYMSENISMRIGGGLRRGISFTRFGLRGQDYSLDLRVRYVF